MNRLPQSHHHWRRPARVRPTEFTPAVLRIEDGSCASAELEIFSLTGGLLSLPKLLNRGTRARLMFLTQTGPVLGVAEMLKPVSWTEQPFRFVELYESDQRRLQAATHCSAEPDLPVIKSKPLMDNGPIAERKPAAENRPTVESRPIMESRPAVENKPVMESAPLVKSTLQLDSPPPPENRPPVESGQSQPLMDSRLTVLRLMDPVPEEEDATADHEQQWIQKYRAALDGKKPARRRFPRIFFAALTAVTLGLGVIYALQAHLLH
jgi:hypothetical protein